MSRESEMIVIGRDESGKATIWCDPEIVDLVKALNDGGVPTVASCSGHGERFGNIALRDGRELLILPNYGNARKVEALVRQADTQVITAASPSPDTDVAAGRNAPDAPEPLAQGGQE